MWILYFNSLSLEMPMRARMTRNASLILVSHSLKHSSAFPTVVYCVPFYFSGILYPPSRKLLGFAKEEKHI